MREAVYAAVIIVMGGALVSVPAAFSISGIKAGFRGAGIHTGIRQLKSDAKFLYQLSETARSSGLAVLEEASGDTADPFLREALLLAAGGFDGDTLNGMLSCRIQLVREFFEESERFWHFLVSVYSVWGMIGALAGLALTSSGSACAADGIYIALLSAGLGIFLSQCAALPVLFRVKSKAAIYIRRMRMITEGLLCVKSGETPRFIKEKLKTVSGLDGGVFD